MWFDEIGEAWLSAQPVHEILIRSREDLAATPMSFLLIHLAFNLGQSDTLARYPAALMGFAAVLLTYLCVRMFLGESTALVATFFMAISPLSIEYSREARNYALLQFATLLMVTAVFLRKKLGKGRAFFCCLHLRSVFACLLLAHIGIHGRRINLV